MDRRQAAVWLLALAACTAAAAAAPAGRRGAAAPRRLLELDMPDVPTEYKALEPLAEIIDVKAMWKLAGLPDPPPLLCHVGVLGWHCHNTTLQPWNPKSIVPRAETPPMPANASCLVCPRGWKGRRGSVLEMLIDAPRYVGSGGRELPAGVWNGVELQRLAAAAAAAKVPTMGARPAAARAPMPAAAGRAPAASVRVVAQRPLHVPLPTAFAPTSQRAG